MTSSLRLSLSASAAILAWFASSVSPVDAKACVQFDAQWNLYAFGGSEDVSLGQNTTWGCEWLFLLLAFEAGLAVRRWRELVLTAFLPCCSSFRYDPYNHGTTVSVSLRLGSTNAH
jgi:hypothetical protein